MLLWLNSVLFAKILDFKANWKNHFGSHQQIAENTKKQLIKESFFYILFKERIF